MNIHTDAQCEKLVENIIKMGLKEKQDGGENSAQARVPELVICGATVGYLISPTIGGLVGFQLA